MRLPRDTSRVQSSTSRDDRVSVFGYKHPIPHENPEKSTKQEFRYNWRERGHKRNSHYLSAVHGINTTIGQGKRKRNPPVSCPLMRLLGVGLGARFPRLRAQVLSASQLSTYFSVGPLLFCFASNPSFLSLLIRYRTYPRSHVGNCLLFAVCPCRSMLS